ncbi:uncharacterized protein VTP21DRAFT_10330 [Calcarisporiella thermophila]|uniref:uncharacterized protein n=1 Tax=Calcarisporiella thermophila TaxID=911321 RepID=UPI0037443910
MEPIRHCFITSKLRLVSEAIRPSDSPCVSASRVVIPTSLSASPSTARFERQAELCQSAKLVSKEKTLALPDSNLTLNSTRFAALHFRTIFDSGPHMGESSEPKYLDSEVSRKNSP